MDKEQALVDTIYNCSIELAAQYNNPLGGYIAALYNAMCIDNKMLTKAARFLQGELIAINRQN